MDGLTYHRETFAGAWKEAEPLAARDWEEMIPYKDAARFGVNIARYRLLESQGMLRVYIARRDGAMVGYMCFLVAPGSLHAADLVRAYCVDWYVTPEERGGFAGYRLKEFAEAELGAESVGMVVVDVMAQSDAAIRLLEKTGYQQGGISYYKVLQEAGHA